MDYNSHTDVVVTRSVSLVNIATPGHRRGRRYLPPTGAEGEAAVLSALAGTRHRRTSLTAGQLAALSATADRLRTVFTALAAGDVDTAAHRVNALLRDTGAHPVLERHDGEPWHIHYHSADDEYAASIAASCATGLAVVLGGEFRDRLGVCTAPECDRVYVDKSRNGTRRFCSTPCQNRVKTAAFRARQQGHD